MKYRFSTIIGLLCIPVATLAAATVQTLTSVRVSGDSLRQVTITQTVKNPTALAARVTKTGFAFDEKNNDLNANAPWLRKSIGLNVFDFVPQATPGLEYQRRLFEARTTNIESSKSIIPNFSLVSSGSTKLLNQDALYWDYTTEEMGRKIRNLLIVTTLNGKDVQALMTTTPNDFDAFRPTFEQVLGTWAVHTEEEETYYGERKKELERSSTASSSVSSAKTSARPLRIRARLTRKASSSAGSRSGQSSARPARRTMRAR